ncbi:MAG: hypothetical protein Kow0022_16800 [Phycisphaerales bacterium]
MSNKASVLLVGHCGPDSFMLRRAVKTMLGTDDVVFINSSEDLESALPDASLVLVNRVLDGSFEHESGIELIRSLAGRTGARLMLVSNYPEAQAEAVAAGAVPGIGKADLLSEQTRQRLKAAFAGVERKPNDPQSDQD